jgi:hypothetical protein
VSSGRRLAARNLANEASARSRSGNEVADFDAQTSATARNVVPGRRTSRQIEYRGGICVLEGFFGPQPQPLGAEKARYARPGRGLSQNRAARGLLVFRWQAANVGRRIPGSLRARLGSAVCAWVALACVAACGGRYDEPGSQGSGSEDPSPSASGSSSSSSSFSKPLPTHPLGDCMPGFDRASNPSRSCQWVTAMGQCFDSFDAACACLCPTTGNSVCSAALSPSPTGATTVYCDKS